MIARLQNAFRPGPAPTAVSGAPSAQPRAGLSGFAGARRPLPADWRWRGYSPLTSVYAHRMLAVPATWVCLADLVETTTHTNGPR